MEQISHLGNSQDLLTSLKDVGRVICMETRSGVRVQGMSRSISLSQLERELVEMFYGIAELGGKRYAVMEELEDLPTPSREMIRVQST